ncbi:MAG TPA: permease [Ignavibacteria bacterium]|nr:permease [Ignavibacteria bacterium]
MEKEKRKTLYYLLFIPILIVLYYNLDWLADSVVFGIIKLNRNSAFASSLNFFIFEVPKVLILLSLIVFAVGIIRSFFSPEKTRKALEGKPLFAGNILAGMLGIVTPFCSCSAIPLFLGFVEAGIPLGVTFSFLIAAPMINEVAIVLLFGLFGLKTALIYIIMGLVIAIFSGWIIGLLKLEKYVEPWVYDIKSRIVNQSEDKINFTDRILYAINTVNEIVKKVWIYIILGIGVGAWVHGYVPENFMAGLMGKGTWWSVPLSVIIGIPLYSNAAGIIPIMQSLIEKGASLGTSLAFMMSIIGLSLPEMIILKKVLKLPLLVIFVAIVGTGIIIVGYLFNLIY